jgi:hypothetical protein
VTLSGPQLYSLFPSLHAHNLGQLVRCIQQLPAASADDSVFVDIMSDTAGAAELAQLRLVSAEQLLGAFQCAEYLYNPKDTIDTFALLSNSASDGAPVTNAPSGLAKQSSHAANSMSTGTSAANLTTSAGSNNTTIAASIQPNKANSRSPLSSRDLLFHDFCFVTAL